MSSEVLECVRCKEIGSDRRHIKISCGYALEELGIPFAVFNDTEGLSTKRYYILTICKKCRSDFLLAIQLWFDAVFNEFDYRTVRNINAKMSLEKFMKRFNRTASS